MKRILKVSRYLGYTTNVWSIQLLTNDHRVLAHMMNAVNDVQVQIHNLLRKM